MMSLCRWFLKLYFSTQVYRRRSGSVKVFPGSPRVHGLQVSRLLALLRAEWGVLPPLMLLRPLVQEEGAASGEGANCCVSLDYSAAKGGGAAKLDASVSGSQVPLLKFEVSTEENLSVLYPTRGFPGKKRKNPVKAMMTGRPAPLVGDTTRRLQ